MDAATGASPEGQDDAIRMIRDSAAAIAPRGGDLRRIRALRFGSPGFDRAVWREMCELGWCGIAVEEAAGGAGLGLAALAALAEQLGAGLVPEPLIACAMAASVLSGEAQAGVLEGRTIVIPAWQETASVLSPKAEARFRDGRVSGVKRFVPMAAGADAFLVSTADGLALVAADAAGVSLTTEPTQDGGHYGTLRLEGAEGVAVAGTLDAALEQATLATAAMMLGAMDRVFAMTVEYLKTRKQFGRPIGSFQALQHRAVDLQVQIALTRASVAAAADLYDRVGLTDASRAAVSRAKARAAEAGLFVTRQAIQLHGGIGYTDEYDAGLFLRRAMVLANQHGGASLHRARFAALAPDEEEAA